LLKGEEVSHDLLYASSKLSALSHYSHDSQTSKTLYATLQVLFDEIRRIYTSSVYRVMRQKHVNLCDANLILASQHLDDDGMAETSRDILDIAKRALDILQVGAAL
jgi:hypothetical protein